MTEACGRYPDGDELVELALGTLAGDERATVVGHLAGCAGCRRRMDDVQRIVDDLLALAPEHEPPAGFEARALREFPGAAPAWPARSRWRSAPVAVAAAVALVVGVAGGGWAALAATRSDRERGRAYEAALDEADGEYFVARRLAALPGGTGDGVVFGYQGDPSWIVVTVRRVPTGATPARVVVEREGGAPFTAEVRAEDDGDWSWGGAIPFDLHVATRVRVETARGEALLAAVIHERRSR